jgi:hypothetical protein
MPVLSLAACGSDSGSESGSMLLSSAKSRGSLSASRDCARLLAGTSCFGGDADAVSHRQVGRGRAPEGASWTGSQHEFDNPTSEEAPRTTHSETAAAASSIGGRRSTKTSAQDTLMRTRQALLDNHDGPSPGADEAAVSPSPGADVAVSLT